MKKIIFGITLASVAAGWAATAAAADFEPPPPVTDLRPATYDWTGPYAGVRVSGITETGEYDYLCSTCGATPKVAEMNGHGWGGGFEAGYNYQMDNFVAGIEGTWEWAGKVAANDEVGELTALKFKDVATIRARAGMAFDDTLIYALGGAAFVNGEFSTSDLGGASAADHKWTTGFVVGGGVQHAFTDRLSGRLEYTYMGLPKTDYTLANASASVDVHHDFQGIHTVSAGLDYNFGW